MSKAFLTGGCLVGMLSAWLVPAYAETGHEHHHSSHTHQHKTHASPIGVMGGHLHPAGKWMVGYHFQKSRMSGLRDGSRAVSTQTVLANYGEVPIAMDMDMHMFEIMYGVTDDFTVMIMPQYMRMGMTHQTMHMGGHSHEHTIRDFGDTEVTGLYSFYRRESGNVHQAAHLNFGVSLPTGSIRETFTDHHNAVYRLPYNMQLGSGTFDPIIGVTYTGEVGRWSWGAQTLNTIRMGKNSHGYRQGNKYTASLWIAPRISELASLSFRFGGEAWENVSGNDASLPPDIIAGANPNEQAGERVMFHVGLNLLPYQEWEAVTGHRLSAEFGIPLYERYSGPQPDTDYRFTLGWQWAF